MHAVDLFAPLDRVVKKYRRDVHLLSTEAPRDAISALESHLSRALPHGLRVFLARHNGAQLFRGALRLRATSEITPASEDAPQVVLFADGNEGQMWAWATGADGKPVFGEWDGEVLTPQHSTFSGWLRGTIAVLDARVTRDSDKAALRHDADPDDVWQVLGAGERALFAGQPDEAAQLFTRATELAPTHVLAWQRLGEALAISDRIRARQAWLAAMRHTAFPLPWPGAPCLDAALLRQLPDAFADPEQWERELTRFLEEAVRDIASEEAETVVVAAATALAQSHVRRGHRSAARDVLCGLVERATLFTWPGTPWSAVLELARLEIDLGNHDEAEKLIRRVRREAPTELCGRALLLLARIAVARQEPWAEEILDEAMSAGLPPVLQAHAAALGIERALRQDQPDAAQRMLTAVRDGSRGIATRHVQGLLAMAEGDAARARQDTEAAWKAYEKGVRLCTPDHDPELHYRLVARIGDMEWAARRPSQAHSRYRDAAQGFARFELPVREAWALLRLARLAEVPGPLLDAARERFFAADLAAGVAAVDAIAGDPGAHLHWHMERATSLAKLRHDAQRSKPPHERADADRPERRLGAHRLAIAACNQLVVDAISREMDATARALAAGSVRSLDPNVLRYIAAVDLLSGHQSFEAATVLLDHLLSRRVDGPPRRALQGAIARSPNAALVDGLLSCIEQPEDAPSHSVAAAAELLGLRRERSALDALGALAERGSNPIHRKAAVIALGRIGDRAYADHIAPALEEPTLAEQAALALLLLGDRRGVDFHGRALNEGRRDLSGSPGEIVGRYGGPSHLLLLRGVSESAEDERANGAIQGLGLMGDPRAVGALLDKLESRDRNVMQIASGALQIITGHAEDMDDPGGRTRWNLWWERNGDRFEGAVRHRHGKVFGVGDLIEALSSSDAWIRRTAYDELVITTGAALPFDSDGPWRVQRAHLLVWHQWWLDNKERFTPGCWYLDGERIG